MRNLNYRDYSLLMDSIYTRIQKVKELLEIFMKIHSDSENDNYLINNYRKELVELEELKTIIFHKQNNPKSYE